MARYGGLSSDRYLDADTGVVKIESRIDWRGMAREDLREAAIQAVDGDSPSNASGALCLVCV